MRNFNEVTYDGATNTVRVGAGNRWDHVQEVLQPLNVAVVGGRIGNVGVGGYMVGGKMRPPSPLFPCFSADDVVQEDSVF
jgi:FAD/FMN-containing dehydrogenase